MNFVIVVSTDNSDPYVYGPYETYGDAKTDLPKVFTKFKDLETGETEDSITSVDIVIVNKI